MMMMKYVCSRNYPACNAHAPFCHLWPAPLYSIFSILSKKRARFKKKSYWTQNACLFVLILSTTFVGNISHSEKSWARYDQKCILVFMYTTCYSYPILLELEFSRQFFEKYPNIKFRENPSGSRLVPCGRTDITKLIVAYRNFANSRKNGRGKFSNYT